MHEILAKYAPTYVGVNIDGPHDLRLLYLSDLTADRMTLWDAERSVATHVPLRAVLRIVEATKGTKLMTAYSRPTDIVIHLLHNTLIVQETAAAKTERQTWIGFGWSLE